MRTTVNYTLDNADVFKQQMLQWSQQFREVVYLDSNNYHQKYTSYDAVLAVDALTSVLTDHYNAFEDLKVYQQTTQDWLFGYLSYDLKNDTEHLQSANYDGLSFPDLFFFQPKKLFLFKDNEVTISYLFMCDNEIEDDLRIIKALLPDNSIETGSKTLNIQQRISKQNYLQKVKAMLGHILRGDIYEANFCMEFFAENAKINPLSVFKRLNEISSPPFAAFFKNNANYILSASPERYLRKEDSKIISQPIKGTSRRSVDLSEDTQIKEKLLVNEKERAENIMIVDLVRNDLSHTAENNSVRVEELCGAYTFKQVHHLISTITSHIAEGITPVDVIKTTFPMGSMTGAPKISAMQIIESLEETKRGIYSGAVGYFTPEGNFDFNVVIRSILYNAQTRYVSFSVGSAITAGSVAENEYDECFLKANAMRQVLNGDA